MFCVGQAKSGTTSLYGLLASTYRTAHEPERAHTLGMILKQAQGEIDEATFRAYLRRRDQRLNLEYDIAWANQFIIDHLLAVFPDAKFIVLIRDPYTWIESMIGHFMSRQIPPDVWSFMDWWFQLERYPHTSFDSALAAQGIYAIAALLNAWNQHAKMCRQLIPPERCLVLRTRELNDSHQTIADFLNIPVSTLNIRQKHLNQRTWTGQLNSFISLDYLNEAVASICSESSHYFPEISSAADADRLWQGSRTQLLC